jgi:predicted transcriptional regulator
MQAKRGRKSTGKPRAMRASVSLSPDIYKTLQAIANQKKVSTAWVLREAAERYVGEQWPLFTQNKASSEKS